jgi:hypothetical protein
MEKENKVAEQSNIDEKENQNRRREAYKRLEQLRVNGTIEDDKAELASYRDEKYSI